MSVLRTARLQLQPLGAQHREVVIGLCADPRVMLPLGGVLTELQAEAWLVRQLTHWGEYGYGRYLVLYREQAIGLVGLSRTDFERGIVPGVELAWRLAFPYWGQGYATEAARAALTHGFVTLGLAELIAVTAEGNTRSRRVMERLGMRHSPHETFDHPGLCASDPLRRHVLYRSNKP